MFQSTIDAFKKILLEFSKKEKIFLLSTVVCVFFISLEYGITRPASTSIFISFFSSKFFPYSWILAVPVNFMIVYLYNRFLPVLGCLKTFLIFASSVIIVNGLTAIFVNRYPTLAFVQFVFKDVYVVLAFKQCWSMIHSTISSNRAKFLYGLMFGMGGLGSVFGGIISGFSAVVLGSSNLFLFTIPLYFIIYSFYKLAYQNSKIHHPNSIFKENFKSKEGFSLIRKSPFLIFILMVVIFMQLSTALLDYQYNVFLEKSISNIDLRTQFAGRITSIINLFSTCFQFLGGFILIHFLGLRKAHLAVPIALGLNSLLFLIFPSFGMATYSFMTIKTLDYSFFGIIREMLYIPLKIDEKYRAKAIIDVFAYRSAKAFASLFLIFVQSVTGLKIVLLISIMSMIIYFIWTRLVSVMFGRYEREQAIRE